MIRYALKCSEGHVFDSWFQSARAFDALAAAGHLSCAECGSASVEKTLMAPKVVAPADVPVRAPDRNVALAELRREVERNQLMSGVNSQNARAKCMRVYRPKYRYTVRRRVRRHARCWRMGCR